MTAILDCCRHDALRMGIGKGRFHPIWAVFGLFLIPAGVGQAGTVTWSGGTSQNWSTPSNWSGGKLPKTTDTALFDSSSSAPCTIDANVSVEGLKLKSGFTGTITQAADTTLTVGSSEIVIQAGTFFGGNGSIDCNDEFTQSGGTFRSTSGALSIYKDFTISGGTFQHNGGTVVLDGWDKDVDVGSTTLNDLNVATGGNSVTTSGVIALAGSLTISSVNYMSGGTIAVAGNVTSLDTSLIGYPGTVILFSGSGNQSLIAGVSQAQVPSVNINKPGGTLSIVGPIAVFNHWTHTAGAVDFGDQPLHFVGFDKTITAGSAAYGDVVFDTGGNSITLSGTMDVDGDLTIQSVNYLSGGDIDLAGNLTTLDADVTGWPASTIRFNGTGNQTLGAGGGYGMVPSIEIDKTGGTLTLADEIGVRQDWTHTAGTVDAGGSLVKFVSFDKTIDAGGMSFNDVEIATGGNNMTVTGTMDVNGNLTITSVNYFQGGTIYVAGNLSSDDASIQSWDAVTLVLDGEQDQTLDANGGAAKFPRDITIDKTRCTGGEVRLTSNLTLDQSHQDLRIVEGILNIEGYTLAVNGTSSKFEVHEGGLLLLGSGATVTTRVNYPELQCGSMVMVSGGATYKFPSNTSADISGVGSNTYWTAVGSCQPDQTPQTCDPQAIKIVRWREVPNSPS